MRKIVENETGVYWPGPVIPVAVLILLPPIFMVIAAPATVTVKEPQLAFSAMRAEGP